MTGMMTGMAVERDFRKLAPATQAELRRIAVAMVRAGKTRIEAAATVGVNRRFVGRWVKAAAQRGEAALAGGRRGRRPGEQKALSVAQEDRLRGLIARGCPDQYGLSFALWTRQAVRALIARETGVWLSLSVVGDYLRGWGFTAQRPMRRATERREGAVRAWLESTYPAIARKARAQGGEIHWADETGLSSRANYGRSFAPKGQTPVIRRPAKRFSQSMISSLTNRGKLRFMIYEGALKAPIFLNFLRRLVREAARKLFVIVDNLPVHRAHRVTAWVHDHADRIELCYLPSYAPEHNPDEFLNNDLKQAMARRRTPQDKAALKSSLTSYMRSLQYCPAKVRTFFQAPSVRYAA
jgi:transposase